MVAIKEIPGIPRIECERLKSVEGAEHRGSPFPPVPGELRNAKRAVSGGIG
jgi:hypothetical protein